MRSARWRAWHYAAETLAGELYESQNNWDQAKTMYQKALQIQPDNPLASTILPM
jgi:predicted negative regulator of RcsB-dependent stress response